MKNTKEIFRENLRHFLQSRGLSLTQAADDCGISLSYMNQLISGKKSFSSETIDKLSKGLSIERYRFFMTEEDTLSIPKNEPQRPRDSSSILGFLEVIQKIHKIDPESIEALTASAENMLKLVESNARRAEKSEK